ncbi:MAG: maltotransferase domain-containing protein [Corynebacterium sp.]|nr:maltotransferase domain-containing protein [Corynebacterium sp.]
MPGRIPIDDIAPVINSGGYPAKGAVGEVIPIHAAVWREGHDAVGATLVVIAPDGTERTQTMTPDKYEQDLVNAVFIPDRPGTWKFRIEGWADPMETWRHAITAKLAAGQSEEEMTNDMHHGADLLRRAGLADAAKELFWFEPLDQRINRAVELTHSVEPLRDFLTVSEEYEILVERRKALYSSWYELFPRSTGGWDNTGEPVHGTLKTTEKMLQYVADMGFDVVYFPPIHPIGTINRKGRNNTLVAEPGDVGSPWAIGSADGGHEAIHPQLGTEEDFADLIARARELGLEIALDLALQCAPDHPWAKEHPDFFTVLADGTIQFAENPPKKYQDIYPINFDNNPDVLYTEILKVVLTWVKRGVHIFRVDNPHTKPANFWRWLIEHVREEYPDVIFLAEAFTRPARLFGLSKTGFSQSYTYFTWKTTKKDLTEFAEMTAARADVSRPNLFTNTPDILHASLQYGGKAMFAIRATLAATMSPSWGMYSGYELYEHEAVAPGSEEYNHSEKYELRPREYVTDDTLAPYIRRLNEIRRENPALQQLRNIHFHDIANDQLLAYSRVDAATGSCVVVVVNLDPHHAQSGMLTLDMEELGLEDYSTVHVHDAISGHDYDFSRVNYIRLAPDQDVAHVLIFPPVAEPLRPALAWRRTTTI